MVRKSEKREKKKKRTRSDGSAGLSIYDGTGMTTMPGFPGSPMRWEVIRKYTRLTFCYKFIYVVRSYMVATTEPGWFHVFLFFFFLFSFRVVMAIWEKVEKKIIATKVHKENAANKNHS